MIIIYISCIIGIFILCKIFIVPVKIILKLVINSLLGGVLIFIINIVGTSFGLHIGLNIITSIMVGILGIPGAILLIMANLLL